MSYASFPVAEDLQIEIIEYTKISNSPDSTAYMILGFLVGFFSVLLFFLPLLLLFVPNKSFRKGIYLGLIILGTLMLTVLLFTVGGWGLVIM